MQPLFAFYLWGLCTVALTPSTEYHATSRASSSSSNLTRDELFSAVAEFSGSFSEFLPV